MNILPKKAQFPVVPTRPRLKYGKNGALIQLVDMQRICYVDSLKPDIKPMERAALARAWTDLEEQKRIIRGKPLPGSLRPEQTKKTKASQPWTPSE